MCVVCVIIYAFLCQMTLWYMKELPWEMVPKHVGEEEVDDGGYIVRRWMMEGTL